MNFKKNEFGYFAVLAVIGLSIFRFLLSFRFSGIQGMQFREFVFAPFPWIFFALLIIAAGSVFLKTKYNKLIMALPSLLVLLVPARNPTGTGSTSPLFSVIFGSISFQIIIGLLSSVAIVTYLFLKVFNKKIEWKMPIEIIFAIIIISQLITWL